MRLENILALTHGTLINEPFIREFTNVVFKAKTVKRGDLFLAFDEAEIEEAIVNGAYGIMFCKPTQISDSEIAWIKVSDLEEALKRILRFKLIDKEIVVYECSEVILKLALQVMTEPNFFALSGDLQSNFSKLWEIESACTVLFSPTLLSRDLFTNIQTLSTNALEKINIVEQTLFETSFIYDNIFYERQLISPFFIPYLEILFHFFKRNKINFRLRKFMPIDHFEPVFTNKNFEIKEFGTSDKVLIFEKSVELMERQMSFLQKEAAWAKLLYILPISYEKSHSDESSSIVYYKNINEINNILRGHSFHFAFIVGADKSILQKPLVSQVQLQLEF
ncbi:MAG: hypothetical protein JXQ67_04285 [Campylobacterales bacterium]|nr:hypothetical protein [Campylobacterales bacterium]